MLLFMFFWKFQQRQYTEAQNNLEFILDDSSSEYSGAVLQNYYSINIYRILKV